jgi:hypothetical protein
MANENLTLWNQLGKTDPDQTKAFQRGGGFKGTAVKPIYTEQKMTEVFGPCGIGWGFTEPQFQVVPGDNKEVLVYCWLSLWILRDGKKSELIPGVGGDKVVSHVKANEKYQRPERWENDDEAFKKAFTDAIGNAMKHLGMSADVHMGLFDDSKYVATRRQEEAAEDQDRAAAPSKPKAVPASATPDQLKAAKSLIVEIGQCKSLRDLETLQRQPEMLRIFDGLTGALQDDVNAAFVQQEAKITTPTLMAG